MVKYDTFMSTTMLQNLENIESRRVVMEGIDFIDLKSYYNTWWR